MAIQTIRLEVRGSVSPAVTALMINGSEVLIEGQRYAATIDVPAGSSSVSLVATDAAGRSHNRSLLIGEGTTASPKASA